MGPRDDGKHHAGDSAPGPQIDGFSEIRGQPRGQLERIGDVACFQLGEVIPRKEVYRWVPFAHQGRIGSEALGCFT